MKGNKNNLIGLQELIIKQKIKIADLAKDINSSPSVIWSWLNKNKIPDKYLDRLVKRFNVSEDYLNEKVNNINTYKPKYAINNYEIRGDTTVIFVVRKNGLVLEVLIDTKELERFIDYNKSWHSAYNQHSDHYYILHGLPEGGRLYFHQWVMGVGTEVYVDHKDNNTLNNRKENLRITDNSNNLKNRKGKNKNNKSGYRNVFWNTKDERWIVALQIDGKQTYFGRFKYEDLHKAGELAEEMRQKYYKDYAGKS